MNATPHCVHHGCTLFGHPDFKLGMFFVLFFFCDRLTWSLSVTVSCDASVHCCCSIRRWTPQLCVIIWSEVVEPRKLQPNRSFEYSLLSTTEAQKTAQHASFQVRIIIRWSVFIHSSETKSGLSYIEVWTQTQGPGSQNWQRSFDFQRCRIFQQSGQTAEQQHRMRNVMDQRGKDKTTLSAADKTQVKTISTDATRGDEAKLNTIRNRPSK